LPSLIFEPPLPAQSNAPCDSPEQLSRKKTTAQAHTNLHFMTFAPVKLSANY